MSNILTVHSSHPVPKKAPLLPPKSVGTLARFGFNVLLLNLIYGTIARTVDATTIGSYWFVIVSAIAVITTSYLTATVLGRIISIKNPIDFDSLRIAASFPNIVALPILIFPSLCEYPVVHEAFGEGSSTAEMYRTCVGQSNTMIFCYFFSWSLLFWTFGHKKLMAAAKRRQEEEEEEEESPLETEENNEEDNEGRRSNEDLRSDSFLWTLCLAMKQTFTSPGFLAMFLGFITASVPPLQQALFSPGGALRFIGAAVETLGITSSSISTMVVAASLVPYNIVAADSQLNQEEVVEAQETTSEHPEEESQESSSVIDLPIMSDPNFGPRQRTSSIRNTTLLIRQRSSLIIDKIKRSDRDMWKLHLWFILSRLIVTPAIVSGGIVALDCGGLLTGIPALSKLVIVINASLPGALIIAVLLKSQPHLSDSAAVVAKVYLPSYLISIVTIAGWASVGLYISVPNEDGSSFCGH